jgi:hypothetical protein
MAKRAVQVRECDRCGKDPANTWVIAGPDGAPREIELCDQHGAPVANAYALARPVQKAPSHPSRPLPDNRSRKDAVVTVVDPEPIWR